MEFCKRTTPEKWLHYHSYAKPITWEWVSLSNLHIRPYSSFILALRCEFENTILFANNHFSTNFASKVDAAAFVPERFGGPAVLFGFSNNTVLQYLLLEETDFLLENGVLI